MFTKTNFIHYLRQSLICNIYFLLVIICYILILIPRTLFEIICYIHVLLSLCFSFWNNLIQSHSNLSLSLSPFLWNNFLHSRPYLSFWNSLALSLTTHPLQYSPSSFSFWDNFLHSSLYPAQQHLLLLCFLYFCLYFC